MPTVQQTLLVGLGSLGRVCLAQFKKQVIASYGELPAFKLVVFDIKPPENAAGGAAADPAQEILSASELLELPQDDLAAAGPGQSKQLFTWLPDKLPELGDTWLSTRAAVRATLHSHEMDIRDFLQVHIQELGSPDVRDRMTTQGFDVTTEPPEARLVIVAGLGDTTGSALILDLVYLISKLFEPNGLHVASTGIFLMPQIAPPAPLAEANAYATLKELNYFRAGHTYQVRYPGVQITSEYSPFNRGCYLIDTRNERGIALASSVEAATLAGEWLFRTLLTPLGTRIDEFTADTGGVYQATGQAPIFSSFGLATYILPVEGLINLSANRLSYDLITKQLLRAGLFGKVSERLGDFLNEQHLRPDGLISDELRPGKGSQQATLQNPQIQSLRTVPIDEIMPRVAAVLNQISKTVLPTLATQIEANQANVIASLAARIDKQVTSVLSENPASGLSLAQQFLQALCGETSHYAGQMKRRELVLDARKKQQGDTLSGRLGPALSNATKSMPSYQLVAVSTIAGLITPVAITSLWLNAGFGPTNFVAGIMVIVIVWLLALGGVVFAALQTSHGIDEARERYTTFLQDRFQTELQLLLVRAAAKIYQPALLDAARDQLTKLTEFTQKLQSVALVLHRNQAGTNLVGKYDFELQRSVLSEKDIEEQYTEFLGTDGSDARLRPLIETKGQVNQWLGYSSEQLEEMFCDYGRSVFANMTDLRVESFLEQQLARIGGMDKLVNDLEAKAAPLLVYNRFAGQVSDSATRTYVGLNNPGESDLKTRFQKASPDSYFESTGDRHSLVVTSVRRGMPLSGMVRLQQFRTRYFDALRNNLVLHLEDEMALLPDPMAAERAGSAMDPGTAFVLGVAFNFINLRDDGTYTVVTEAGNVRAVLTADKISSALVIDDNPALLKGLEDSIHSHVSTMGNSEATNFLLAASNKPGASDWEKARIVNYTKLLSA